MPHPSNPITLVDDHALPPGQDFMMMFLPDGTTAVFLRRSALTTDDRICEVIGSAWLACRAGLVRNALSNA